MSNLSALQNYNISSNELNKLLKIYTLIGEKNYFLSLNKNKSDLYINKSKIKDAKLIVDILKLDVSFERTRLILEKDSTPKTVNERKVAGILKVLNNIYYKSDLSKDDSAINSSDILDYLKVITQEEVKFITDDFKVYGDSKKSVRYKFNIVLDEYQDLFMKESYENLLMASTLLMELYNINPYTKFNDLAFILTFEYLMLRCNIYSFKFCGFIELYKKYEPKFYDALTKGSINYSSGVLFVSPFFNLLLDFIIESFENLKNIKSIEKEAPHALKSDLIEKAIIEDLPVIFSKEDIKKLFPDASDSTIMRSLVKLSNLKYIISLGTGRGAKWQRIVDKNDKLIIFGDEL